MLHKVSYYLLDLCWGNSDGSVLLTFLHPVFCWIFPPLNLKLETIMGMLLYFHMTFMLFCINNTCCMAMVHTTAKPSK